MDFDYDYVIESFYTEYKLNVDTLASILLEYNDETKSETEKFKLYLEFKRLYPEYPKDDLVGMTKELIPKTVKKKVWFVQPPRDKETGRPLHFYSLKSRLLTRLRDLRKDVKKLQKEAGKKGDKVNEVRYNAMQLAIKIIMNTEYGASGNKLFAHYDPDIAGAVTFLSRTLIGFLTKTLEGNTFYVDKRFLEENIELIDRLSSIKCISGVEHIPKSMTAADVYKNRVRTIRRVYDDKYNVLDMDLFRIDIERSLVIYQDTDSNYYVNPYIQKYYTSQNMTPKDIKECMVSMIAHNDFVNNFAVSTINRTPVGLGFEGAFIIARYFYRKKKYYGVKYDNSLLAEIPEGQKWKPKISCEPQPNGDYIYLDNSVLLANTEIVSHGKQKDPNAIVVNYLDYIKGQGIKCTGVNLARRDQYKFINYYHMMVIQKDMQVIQKDGDTWHLSKEKSMINVINNIIERYQKVVQTYISIGADESKEVPPDTFKLVDFSRPKPYDETKQGTMQKIIGRMKEDEDAEQYIPENGERINVVVVMNDAVRQARLRGTAGMGQTGERSFTVEELLEKTRRTLRRKATFEYIQKEPDSELAKKVGHVEKFSDIRLEHCLDVEFDEAYVDAYACSNLDFKYYLLSLASAMALYIVDEKYPNEIAMINNGQLSEAEGEKLVDKLQKKIGKEILDKYYPTKAKPDTEIRNILSETAKAFKKERKVSKKYPYTIKYYLDMADDSEVEENAERIRTNAERVLQSSKDAFESVGRVYKIVSTNLFTEPVFKTEMEKAIYNDFLDDLDGYEEALRKHSNEIYIYTKILEEIKYLK